MTQKVIELVETDEAGNLRATYVQSAVGDQGNSRVDVITPEGTKSLWQSTLDVFLPTGYPHSVTQDYMEYQIYDSLQAFSSSIAGLLSSRAVLSSVGVGDASASPTAALLLSIFQESIGRIATILFAHRFGTAFEPECKMYRLLADVLNDIAFVLDCLSPTFPKPYRVVILSVSSVLRALCGVAAGSAKASLSAHFARWGNLGELNAKDSSQETVISLLGMLVGTLVVSWLTTPFSTWTALIVLLSIHLETNRRAVRAVIMHTLNRQRATLVYHHLIRGSVPTPVTVAQEEQIFERSGILRRLDGTYLGHCSIGVPMTELLKAMAPTHTKTGSTLLTTDLLFKLSQLFERQAYLLWYTVIHDRVEMIIVVKKSATPIGLVAAWWHALELAARLCVQGGNGRPKERQAVVGLNDEKLRAISMSLKTATERFKQHKDELEAQGWDLTVSALETRPGTRVTIR